MTNYQALKFLCVGLFFTSLLAAQTSIKGTVLEADMKPLPYANVVLIKATDSTLVKGTMTNDLGVFQMEYQEDTPLTIVISFMGYSDFTMNLRSLKNTADLGEIILKKNAQSLSEVVIIGKRPLFVQKIDRTVVNVQNSAINAGNTALNVLSKSPSVGINRTTNQINLMGKQGVLVMIDNRQTRMEAADLMNLLESMPADNIDTIELITSPPASYDAQGSAGIININTIKKNIEGFTGRTSANFAYGEQEKYGASLNMTYKKKKIYVFGSLSANINPETQRVSLYTDYSYPNDRVVSNMFSPRDTKTGLYSGEIGLDYDLSKKTVFGVLVNFYNRDWKMDAISNTDINSQLNGLSQQFVRSSEENVLFRTLMNVNIRHQFSENSSFNIDYDYINFTRDNPTSYEVINTINGVAGNSENSLSSADTPLNINVVKADFKLGESDEIQIETGVKTTLSNFENTVRVAFKEGEVFVDDPDFTDVYVMDEQIYAAYFSLDWQLTPSITFKSGLRYEYYDLVLDANNKGSIVDRNKGNFFPSMYMNYRPNNNHELNLSFVKRIERPGFQSLAPYFYFFNQNTLFTGNANLVPANADQYTINYRFKTLNLGLQFTNTQRPIFGWQPGSDQERQLVVIKPVQGLESKAFSLSASLPVTITPWWSSRFSAIGYHRKQTTIIDQNFISDDSNNMVVSTNHNFNLGKQWKFEVNAEYNSPVYEGLARTAARSGLDLGIQKKFKNGAALSFNVNDVFDSSSQWPITADASNKGIFYDWKYDGEGPIFRLNYSIPLGNLQLKKRAKRSSGSEEEQQRLN